jgi:hypothetical protein
MAIVGGLDVHRRQITFDYLDTVSGQVRQGRITPACREVLRRWLTRFAGRDDVALAVEACTGWRFVVEELERGGIEENWLGGGAPMWWSHADAATYRRSLTEAGRTIDAEGFAPEGNGGHQLFWARTATAAPR